MTYECDKYSGRLRDLCEGRGRDGRLPVRMYDAVQFRLKRGLSPEPPYTGRNLPQAAIDEPVGDLFRDIVQSLGISKLGGCGCKSMRTEMNRLGISGCKRDRERLIEKLRLNAASVGWINKLIAVPLAVWTGLAFKVNPLDPLPGMLDEAIRITETGK